MKERSKDDNVDEIMAACCDAELLTRVKQVVRLNHNLEGVLVSLWFWKREARALEGRRVSSKSPSRFRDGDERVDGRKSEKSFPDEVFSRKGSKEIN